MQKLQVMVSLLEIQKIINYAIVDCSNTATHLGILRSVQLLAIRASGVKSKWWYS